MDTYDPKHQIKVLYDHIVYDHIVYLFQNNIAYSEYAIWQHSLRFKGSIKVINEYAISPLYNLILRTYKR
jgi:hypothetical protein